MIGLISKTKPEKTATATKICEILLNARSIPNVTKKIVRKKSLRGFTFVII